MDTTTAATTPPPPPPPLPTTPTTTPSTVTPSRPRHHPPRSDVVVLVPSHASWFSWNSIHETEVRFLPEFFDGKSNAKNPEVYKYYRNSIIRHFRECVRENRHYRENPIPKITFTEARRTIVGDVGSVRKVFDFLEAWGLINYHGSSSQGKPQLKLGDDKESKSITASLQLNNDAGGVRSAGDVSAQKKMFCSNCYTACSQVCFTNVKKDVTYCARCHIKRGQNSSDFKRVEISDKGIEISDKGVEVSDKRIDGSDKRVEISEDRKTDWSEKDTLHLLEAVMRYGDDWKKVSECVKDRSDKECVNRFIKLPFGEQFIGPPESAETDENFYLSNYQSNAEPPPSKRIRPTPLTDASNPITAQAAFLSALVGVKVAKAAASEALKALLSPDSESHLTTNGKTAPNSLQEAKLQLEKEEQDFERSIINIAEVEAKEMQDKIVHFEELDLQMEMEYQQLRQMENLLFADQLALTFHKPAQPKRRDSMADHVKAE